ncbi:MAG: hypothetical protein JNK02_06065 [Planctomycetes bacterium]|nr:hypothetical protein [Planctomycetota bacterium]
MVLRGSSRLGVLVGVACACSAGVASAQASASAAVVTPHATGRTGGPVLGVQQTYVADGLRSEVLEVAAPLAASPASQALAAARGLWSYPDGGEGWVGRAVALGNGGTQAFAEFDTAADRAVLLSGFDVAPVVPVWSDPVPLASSNVRVHAAGAAGRFVSCRQFPVAQNGPRQVVVSTYDSGSATPRWSWSFPLTTYGASRAMLSADGSRVVAAMLVPATAELHVAVFDGAAALPTATFAHPVGLQLQALVLSEDGRWLYAATGTGGYLFDVDARALAQQFVLLQSFAAQDISGDGRVLAVGYFNGVDVWERQHGGAYVRTWQGTWPGAIVCQQLDVSEDGSTLVLGFGYYDQNLRVRIEALDVASKSTTMFEEVQGAGTHQNVVARIAASADGSTFAVGLWGDQAGLVPELRVYRRDQGAPLAVYDYGGSVQDLAISRDGARVLVGVKSVHANVLAGGGAVDLYSTRPEDFVASGVPSVGRKVDFDLWGAPNSAARLLLSPLPATDLTPFGSWGVLYLNRTQLSILPMSATDATGHARGELQLAPDPATIGTTLWFQGLTLEPRRFTADFAAVQILP